MIDDSRDSGQLSNSDRSSQLLNSELVQENMRKSKLMRFSNTINVNERIVAYLAKGFYKGY